MKIIFLLLIEIFSKKEVIFDSLFSLTCTLLLETKYLKELVSKVKCNYKRGN